MSDLIPMLRAIIREELARHRHRDDPRSRKWLAAGIFMGSIVTQPPLRFLRIYLARSPG